MVVACCWTVDTVLGIAFIKFGPKWPGPSNAKLIGTVLVGLGVIANVVDYIEISAWTNMRSAYERRIYSTVEGPVHNFKPMPYEGHQEECFSIENQMFCYSDYEPQPGFHQSTSHGGPIREGLPVRVAYYEEQILRLEVRADSLTPNAVRTANSKAEEAKWQERAMNDPKVDHMLLGFSFAVVVVSLFWNFGWRHYIGYWIRRDRPYSAGLEFAFRAFFLVSFLGAFVHLYQLIKGKHRSVADFKEAALISLIGIGFFGVYDLIMRRRLRSKGQPTNG
jgi:hypothetical protein